MITAGRANYISIKRLAVSHLGPHAARQQPLGDILVTSPYFTASKLRISPPVTRLPALTGEFLVLIEGSATANGQSTAAGDVWYRESGETELSGNATILRIRP